MELNNYNYNLISNVNESLKSIVKNTETSSFITMSLPSIKYNFGLTNTSFFIILVIKIFSQ